MSNEGTRQKIWRETAQELGALEDALVDWGNKIRLQVHDWQVVLEQGIDDPVVRPFSKGARMFAHFANAKALWFELEHTNFIKDAFVNFFGMQDIEVGERRFDARFVVKGSDEKAVQTLFADEELRRLVIKAPHGSFSIIDEEVDNTTLSYPKDVDVLLYKTHLSLDNAQSIKDLFKIFEKILAGVYAHNHARTLSKGERPLLNAMKATIENELEWCMPLVERVGEGLCAPLVPIREHKARMTFSAPHFPLRQFKIEFDAQLPKAHTPFAFKRISNPSEITFTRSKIKIDDVVLDKNMAFEGETRSLAPLKTKLHALLKTNTMFSATCGEGNLTFSVKGVQNQTLVEVARIIVEIWQCLVEIE